MDDIDLNKIRVPQQPEQTHSRGLNAVETVLFFLEHNTKQEHGESAPFNCSENMNEMNNIKVAEQLEQTNSRGLNAVETVLFFLEQNTKQENGESAVPDLSQKQDTVHQAFAENKPEVTTTKMTEVKCQEITVEDTNTVELETEVATEEKIEEPKVAETHELDTQIAEATYIGQLAIEPKSPSDNVMTCTELCQSCLREDENEVADLWCNDCSEAVCRGCGKAHRRFAVAHDVIWLKDAPACRKHIHKNCLLHENNKLILFCVGHDTLICHVCLSESHRSCDKILEIKKAAEGIKNSAAITDLKERMTKFTSVLEKAQIENEQTMSKISREKESANDHIKDFLQCFQNHLTVIQKNLDKTYNNIVKQNQDNSEQLKYLRQSMQENNDLLFMLERESSESNIFHAVKRLDAIQVLSEKQIEKTEKDLATLPLDVLPPEGTTYIDKLFKKLKVKTKLKTMPVANVRLTSECLQSQIKVERPIPLPLMIERSNQPQPELYQELMSDENCLFGALCFTEDGRIVVEKSIETPSEKTISSGQKNHCLQIFDPQTNQSKHINLSQKNNKFNMSTGSVCMYDAKLALLVINDGLAGIMGIDIALQRHCRTIYPQRSERLGIIKQIRWVSSKMGKILLFTENRNGLWLISIDFNGTVLSTCSLSNSIVDVDSDGSKRLFYTDGQVNDIFVISTDREITSKCYSSLDLKEGCRILHVVDDELLLLEKNSNTIYKLDLKNRRRSILTVKNISNSTHFNFCKKLKKVAVTMDGGMRIRIFPF